jgi:hypothetical protein
MDEQQIRQEERTMALRWIRYCVLDSRYTSLHWIDGANLMEKNFEKAMEEDFSSWKKLEKKMYGEKSEEVDL